MKSTDTRKTINTYIENYIGESKPVIVKSLKSVKGRVIYLVLALKPIQIEEVLTTKLLPTNIEDYLIKEDYIKDVDDVKGVVHCGDLEDYYAYEGLVSKFSRSPYQEFDRKPTYRNYIISREEQLKLMNSVNPCYTPWLSWESVLLKIGSKKGIILKILKTNEEFI